MRTQRIGDLIRVSWASVLASGAGSDPKTFSFPPCPDCGAPFAPGRVGGLLCIAGNGELRQPHAARVKVALLLPSSRPPLKLVP